MSEQTSDINEKFGAGKTTVTFYLAQNLQEDIEDILFHMKKQVPFNKRRKITKAFLFETVIRHLIEDYNVNGKEGYLWKAVRDVLGD